MPDSPAALVTGASRGIGRAIALELARLGYAVTVNYATRPEAAEQVVADIHASGGRAIALGGDVGRSDDRARLVERTTAEFGRLDVLVNNAGITSVGRQDLLSATEESWDRVFDTNLKGPFFLSQLAARTMIELIRAGKTTGGKIVTISSISAYAVSSNRADYCMTKAALQMMTWLLEVCPGVVRSDMTAPVQEKYDRLIKDGMTPIRRWGEPEDVARAVAAIVSEYFPFSTGERFNVDGGFHIRRL